MTPPPDIQNAKFLFNGTEIIFDVKYHHHPGKDHPPALFQYWSQHGWLLLRIICLRLQVYSLFARMSSESYSSEGKYLQTLIHSTNIHWVAVAHKSFCYGWINTSEQTRHSLYTHNYVQTDIETQTCAVLGAMNSNSVTHLYVGEKTEAFLAKGSFPNSPQVIYKISPGALVIG